MRALIIFMLLLCGSCAKQPYSGMDVPSSTQPTTENEIISYIDKRLEDEYYWLDEVNQKRSLFNRRLPWEQYLHHALSKLTTNEDDGSYNSQGQRSYYSYIRDVTATRGERSGFGILLHYTILIIDNNNRYGFVVESVYPNSPAEMAGIKRGDIIVGINGRNIDNSNYVNHFNNIQSGGVGLLDLSLKRRSESGAEYSASIESGVYNETPIAHYDVIDVEGYDKRIGYLSYLGFESEYNDELSEVLTYLASEGVKELILDLRCNGGGALSSALLLCSAIVPSSYEGQTLCRIERNKKNAVASQHSDFKLENTGQLLNLERLTVLCSGNSASASELVVMGLRGLDFPVTLIGATTEGKNCGMDVTYKHINGKDLEYAPITFMCFNAKGFGDWGEGIVPDVDLTSSGNKYGVYDEYYPLPYTDWGDSKRDIGLAVALADITGRGITQKDVTRSGAEEDYDIATTIARPVVGTRLYDELNVMK
ncbi:MAG: PDZ domain-containing protein [Alistipes sp.]|nr:PDZ domain-containing protein [Alistipes sp.]